MPRPIPGERAVLPDTLGRSSPLEPDQDRTFSEPARSGKDSVTATLRRRLIRIVLPGSALGLAAALLFKLGAPGPSAPSPSPPSADRGAAPVPAGMVEPPSITTSSEIRRNPGGQITSITAAHPGTVLDLLCDSTGGRVRRTPLKIAPAGENWIGYYRESGSFYAIEIRKDARTNLWTAGNGRNPLVAAPASHVPLEPDTADGKTGGG